MTTVSTAPARPGEGGAGARATDARDEPRVLGLLARGALVRTGLLALAFVLVFWRWFLKQGEHSWTAVDDWGHAFLVPLISGYLVYQRRHELAAMRPEVFWPALAPFALGILSYFFFVVGFPNHMFQGFALVLTLFGLVLLLVGPRMIGPLFLPIAYLGFGVTVAEMVMIELTFRLQLVASAGAWMVLNVVGWPFGFSCDLAGNTLNIITSNGSSVPLNVAEACSGMRMVVAFFALAVATALLACRHWWQRAALLVLAAPVAITVNIARVAVLGVLSLWDADLAAGQAHTLIGTLLLIPGLALFLLVVWVLNRSVREAAPGLAGAGGGA